MEAEASGEAATSDDSEEPTDEEEGADSQEEPARLFPYAMIPRRHTKLVHLIRHGEGVHNKAVEQAGGRDVPSAHALYKSPAYEDAQLTKLGWEQATALRLHINQQGIRPRLIIVSPLTRTLQTAALAFGNEEQPPWNAVELKREPALMDCAAQNDWIDAAKVDGGYSPISSTHNAQFVANELCREQLGVHPCDKRRPLQYYRERFPAVDFAHVPCEEDVLWDAERRESVKDIRERAVAFLQWLTAQPQTEVAVVTHSAFLTRGLLPLFGGEWDGRVAEDMHAHFDNCELRTMVLSDGTGGGGLRRQNDPSWFSPHNRSRA